MTPPHGSPEDRGAADAHYGRAPIPHRHEGPRGMGGRVEALTPEETRAYWRGFHGTERDDNEGIHGAGPARPAHVPLALWQGDSDG